MDAFLASGSDCIMFGSDYHNSRNLDIRPSSHNQVDTQLRSLHDLLLRLWLRIRHQRSWFRPLRPHGMRSGSPVELLRHLSFLCLTWRALSRVTFKVLAHCQPLAYHIRWHIDSCVLVAVFRSFYLPLGRWKCHWVGFRHGYRCCEFWDWLFLRYGLRTTFGSGQDVL